MFAEAALEEGLSLGELAVNPASQISPDSVDPGVQLHDPLLQLGIEAGKVDLVELSQLAPVSGVHLIEPVYKLVRDFLAQALVKSLDNLAVTGIGGLWVASANTVQLMLGGRVTERLQPEPRSGTRSD